MGHLDRNCSEEHTAPIDPSATCVVSDSKVESKVTMARLQRRHSAPQLDEATVCRTERRHSDVDTASTSSSGRSSVSFSDVQVREYSRTLGDNWSVTNGPPISLGWEYVENQPVCLDSYEEGRSDRKCKDGLRLVSFERRQLLYRFDVSEKEIKANVKKMKKLREEIAKLGSTSIEEKGKNGSKDESSREQPEEEAKKKKFGSTFKAAKKRLSWSAESTQACAEVASAAGRGGRRLSWSKDTTQACAEVAATAGRRGRRLSWSAETTQACAEVASAAGRRGKRLSWNGQSKAGGKDISSAISVPTILEA